MIIIDNKQQMHMVRHNDELPRRQGWVQSVNCKPKCLDATARPRQVGTLRALHETRQHGPPPPHANREEEELPTVMRVREVHEHNYQKAFFSCSPNLGFFLSNKSITP